MIAVRVLCLLCASLLLSACAQFAANQDKERQNREDAATFNADLGTTYLRRGDLELARSKLEKALEQDPRNALAHAGYAQLQAAIGDTESAREHFRRSLQLDPDAPDNHNVYGVFLCEQGEYEDALEQFRISADDPYYETPEFPLDNAGQCLLEANRLPEAEQWLLEAVRRNPRFSGSFLHMADLRYRQAQFDTAVAYLKRYRALASETPASLWLALRIHRDGGDRATAEQFASRLLNDFPTSREAGEYLAQSASQ